jgi:predicted GNAT family acetyltransferase
MSVISHDPAARRFSTEIDGSRAYLDYTLAGSEMTITHTRVPEAIGGRGVAAELMAAALRTAKDAGWSVDPACSYAAAYMKKHPSEGHTRQEDGGKKHIDDQLDEALDESFPASDSPTVGDTS